jgi:DNA-binding cell septation regulator SpoVG
MKITDVKVRKLYEEGPMKAIVSVTFDDQLALHDIKVISAREKTFITMPSRKNPDETYRDNSLAERYRFRTVMYKIFQIDRILSGHIVCVSVRIEFEFLVRYHEADLGTIQFSR